jgi:vancomycin resistance protein YoaR
MSWLSFDTSLDQDKLTKFAKELNQSLRLDPIDAVFHFENGRVSQFKSSQPGRFVDEILLASTLNQSLDNLLQSDSTDSVDIPFQYIDPIIKNEDANDLGIKELLGRGESSFSHSSAIRNKNIQRGAQVVNFVLVPPGETFSFNKNLGEVSVENGYHMAYIIRQGRTELDVGGGICQVSTTVFRAALNSGLPITERRPHAYRVSYYEEGSDPGFDATIFLPSPDLKFENDTAHHILIQSFYDGDKKTLAYEIYGTSDGRSVKIENYRKWDYSQPPPDRFIDDPTLAPGQLVQIEQRIPGLKTAFDWTVEKDGQILHQKTFSSSYTPWAAVFRRGPSL